jgi:putative molybdopterin biosynthesis protein
MEEQHLYLQIIQAIRQQILDGELKTGDRLPSVRAMSAKWGCTIGTIQHAYQELSSQGLVTTRPGQGTHVVKNPPVKNDTPLRRATLVHRAEAFLLEVLTAGYAPNEVEDALRQALEHWRTISEQPSQPTGQVLSYTGSHDLAVAWLATHFNEIVPGYALQLSFTGSLGGLIALAEGKTDLAGCHLWDAETGSYNIPFIRRLLPGQHIALVTLAQRRIGLITSPGNPLDLQDLSNLSRAGLRIANRQSGSGTRVWLDAHLSRLGIEPQTLLGYNHERMTHSEVAQAVAEGQADVGVGLEAVARTYGLDFILLTSERFDLVFPEKTFNMPAIQRLMEWLQKDEARQAIARLGGYDTANTGKVEQVS